MKTKRATSTKTPICRVICFNNEKINRLRDDLPAIPELKKRARHSKALAHPIRQAIIEILKNEECCVCDLGAIIDCPLSTLSGHLKILRENDIINCRSQGKLVFYRLDPSKDTCK
ncbi:ArsR/SmtB family transcription factor [Candidatus Riflebacteria bacterium]